MGPGVAGAVAAAVVVPLVLALLRASSPARAASATERPLDELARDYQKWDLATLPLFFASAPASAYVIYRGLRFAGSFLPNAWPDARFALVPGPSYWGIVALFVGIAVGVLPVLLVLRLALGARYPEYVRYGELKHGINPRVYVRLLYGYGAVCLTAVGLAFGWNVRLTERAIHVNPLFSLSETAHPYSEVESITTAPRLVAPNGNLVERREYSVRFRDGSHWSTTYEPSEATPETKAEIVEFIAQRSGVPVTEVDALRREDVD